MDLLTLTSQSKLPPLRCPPPPALAEANGRRGIVAQYVAVPLLLLILWEVSVRYGWVPNTLIASPTQVLFRLVGMLGDLTLFHHALVSLKRLSAGFFFGTVVG